MWKIGNLSNELDDLAKDISRQTTKITTWFLVTDCDKMIEERNNFKSYHLVFK